MVMGLGFGSGFFFLVVFRSMWLVLAFKGIRASLRAGASAFNLTFFFGRPRVEKARSHELNGSKRVRGVIGVEIDKVRTENFLQVSFHCSRSSPRSLSGRSLADRL